MCVWSSHCAFTSLPQHCNTMLNHTLGHQYCATAGSIWKHKGMMVAELCYSTAAADPQHKKVPMALQWLLFTNVSANVSTGVYSKTHNMLEDCRKDTLLERTRTQNREKLRVLLHQHHTFSCDFILLESAKITRRKITTKVTVRCRFLKFLAHLYIISFKRSHHSHTNSLSGVNAVSLPQKK